MLRIGTATSILIGGLAILVGAHSVAEAAQTQPCVTNAASGTGGPAITFKPINGGGQTYCQSAYGWSDTWFATSQPSTYNQHLDVLSGDDAPDLIYKTATTTVKSGNTYSVIGPWLDAGHLNSSYLGSNWTVVNDLSVSGNVGTSTIRLGSSSSNLTATITTTVTAGGVTEAFVFKNNTSGAITDILFSDYFNFHANGSTGSNISCPTTTFNGTTVKIVGSNAGGCSAIVSSGSMFGSAAADGTPATPLAWDLGVASGSGHNVLTAMQTAALNGNYSNFNNLLGPVTGDGAVDVVWDIKNVAAGGTANFTIFKNFKTPEPASLALLVTGLVGLGLVRRRRGQV